MLQPARQGADDVCPAQAVAAGAAHRQYTVKAKFCAVVAIELLQLRCFSGRAMRQTGGVLFLRRRRREGGGRLAGQLRMRADQRHLGVRPGVAHGLGQRKLQLRQGSKRAAAQRVLKHPGRVLIQSVKRLPDVCQRTVVDVFKRGGHEGGRGG